MKRLSDSLLCLLLLVPFLSSCSHFPSKKPLPTPSKPVVEGPKLIGRIASIPADRRFVLIQSYGGWKIEAGRILTTRGADQRSANLRVTGESLGDFAAADLQSGLLEVGDAVYVQHEVKPATAPAESLAPAVEPEQIPEKLQKNN
jgi:hypothetical protein